MTHDAAHLTLHAERCDRCGRCVNACGRGALKVGMSYIYVDWHACDACNACVEACDRAAIVPKTDSTEPVSARPPRPIHSRADAKAARKSAKAAEKQDRRTRKTAEKNDKVFCIVSARAEAIRADGMVTWSALDALAVLAVLLLSFVAKDAILSARAVRLMPESGQVVARTLVLGAFYAVQLWTLGYLAARHGAGPVSGFGLGRMGRSVSAKFATGATVLGLALATRLITTAYGAIVRALGWLPPSRTEGDLTALFGSGSIGLALSVLLVVVVAPLAEELAFRGVIMPVVGQNWGKWPAVLVSAAVFSAYHFTPWLLFPTFMLGSALGWLAWERRSLWPAIALHALYNGTAVAAAFFVASS